jgi:hypothetical protein
LFNFDQLVRFPMKFSLFLLITYGKPDPASKRLFTFQSRFTCPPPPPKSKSRDKQKLLYFIVCKSRVIALTAINEYTVEPIGQSVLYT